MLEMCKAKLKKINIWNLDRQGSCGCFFVRKTPHHRHLAPC